MTKRQPILLRQGLKPFGVAIFRCVIRPGAVVARECLAPFFRPLMVESLVAADRGQRSIVWLGDRAEVCTNDVVDRARDSSGRPAIIADQVALTRNHPIPIRIDLPVRRTQDRIPVDHMAAVDICSIVWRMAAPDSARARFGKTIPLRVATVCHWPLEFAHVHSSPVPKPNLAPTALYQARPASSESLP